MDSLKMLKTITVHHANHPDTVIELVAQQVFAWYLSPTNKCLHVVSMGGAMLPIIESSEQFGDLLKASNRGDLNEGVK
jgi:hypothetical protein